jgi:hypothetical protein
MHPQLLCIHWRRKLPMGEAELSDGRDPRRWWMTLCTRSLVAAFLAAKD